jgi:hypothetical protein
MHKNKSIDKITKANTKSRNKKEKEPNSRWRERNVVEEQLEPGGRKRTIETDEAKGKGALGNGRTWKRKRENVVLLLYSIYIFPSVIADCFLGTPSSLTLSPATALLPRFNPIGCHHAY